MVPTIFPTPLYSNLGVPLFSVVFSDVRIGVVTLRCRCVDGFKCYLLWRIICKDSSKCVRSIMNALQEWILCVHVSIYIFGWRLTKICNGFTYCDCIGVLMSELSSTAQKTIIIHIMSNILFWTCDNLFVCTPCYYIIR